MVLRFLTAFSRRRRSAAGRSDIRLELHGWKSQADQTGDLSPIGVLDDGIEVCEPRLALSASLASGLLLDALDPAPLCPNDPLRLDGIAPRSLEQSPHEAPAGLWQTSAEPIAVLPQSVGSLSESSSPGPHDLLDQAAGVRDSFGLTGSGQTIAVIDSGVAWDHVAFGGGYGPGYRVVGGWDFAENDADPYDDGPSGFHGTHVAGLLAGSAPGFTGMASSADLVALRVFDDSGAGQLPWIELALRWVVDHQNAFDSPITTVNLSVGAALSEANLAEANSLIADEIEQLRSSGILVFAAAGNAFSSDASPEQPSGQSLLYPASSDSVVAVSSTDSLGNLSDFAQRRSGILATVGKSVGSSVPDHVFGWDGNIDDFAQLDGTSMATPQVAAASVLIREAIQDAGLDATAEDVLNRLRASAHERLDPTSGAAYHVIDLQAAVQSILGDAPSAPDDTAADSMADEMDPPMQLKQSVGTDDGEAIVLDLRDGIKLRVDGVDYEFPLSGSLSGSAGQFDLPSFSIDAGAGADSLQIIGSANAERLVLHPSLMGGASQLATNGFVIDIRGFEGVAFDGGGGPDRATLYDSRGDDTLKSHPGSASLSGVGFRFEVTSVPRTYVHATAGGSDTAFLHDSAGDDSLAVRPQFSSLRSASTFQLAYGFERLYAYASAGGMDTAELHDSAGDDVMSVSSSRSQINGDNYQVSARGFQSVTAFASAGGDDLVRIYADQTGSRWHTADDLLQWTGADQATRSARGFERSLAFEQYEPIELAASGSRSSDLGLQPQSAARPLLPWDPDEKHRYFTAETEASRHIFGQLGRQEVLDRSGQPLQ